MTASFTALLLAHVLADFLFQTKAMVAHKRNPLVLAAHAGVVLAAAGLALGRWDAWEIAALAGAHLVIDAIKTYGRFAGLAAFLTDQTAHLATLAATAALAPGLWSGGHWAGQDWLLHLYLIATGLILVTRTGGFAVGLLMAPYAGTDLPKGLDHGGRTIGMLERLLIFVFVLAGQPTGIGFLIAAKSILRFDTAKDHRASEYVIIGTLASFAWALVVAYAITALRAALPDLAILPPSP